MISIIRRIATLDPINTNPDTAATATNSTTRTILNSNLSAHGDYLIIKMLVIGNEQIESAHLGKQDQFDFQR